MGAMAELEDLSLLGRGSFGAVYRAFQPRLGRTVAVKVLGGEFGDGGRRLFASECQTMGALSSHPNVVTIYDAGLEDDRLPFIIMEYLPAGSLAEAIGREGPVLWRTACEMGTGLGSALASAHGAGILHRDIKPHNVLLSNHGSALLCDFGLARFEDQTVTHVHMAPGTVAYMAPELFNGTPNSERTDVYALAATIYHALFGFPPHVRPDMTMAQTLAVLTTSDGVRIDDPAIPDDLATGLEWALARDPARRCPTADDLMNTFVAALGEVPTPGGASAAPTVRTRDGALAAEVLSPPGQPGSVRQQAVLAILDRLGGTSDLKTLTDLLRSEDPALMLLERNMVRDRVANTLNVLQHKVLVANDPSKRTWSLVDGLRRPPAPRTSTTATLRRDEVVAALDELGGRGRLPAITHRVMATDPRLGERGYLSVRNSVATALSHLQDDGRVRNHADQTWSIVPPS